MVLCPTLLELRRIQCTRRLCLDFASNRLESLRIFLSIILVLYFVQVRIGTWMMRALEPSASFYTGISHILSRFQPLTLLVKLNESQPILTMGRGLEFALATSNFFPEDLNFSRQEAQRCSMHTKIGRFEMRVRTAFNLDM